MINPLTSSMAKYYEITKSKHSRDIDHLVNFTKNGLGLEKISRKLKELFQLKNQMEKLVNLKIFHFDEGSNLIEKITSEEAIIETNTWVLKKVLINKLDGDILYQRNSKNIA